jgi:hypothetical protein
MKLRLVYCIITTLLTAAWADAQLPSPLPVLSGSQNPSPQNSLPSPLATGYTSPFDEPTTNISLARPYTLLPFGPSDRIWGSAEYLLWWVKDPRLPPLVTSSPAGTPFGTADVLGQPTTTVLFGDGPQNMGAFSGGRFTLGYWIAPGDTGVGIQASGFFLVKRTDFSASSDSNGNPSIGRPFVSALTGTEQAYTVSFGNPTPFATGNVNVGMSSRLWGTEFDMALAGEDAGTSRRTWLLGFRYADLAEKLSITQGSTLLPGGGILFGGDTVVQAPDGVSLTDSFRTRNQFYGGQFGLRQAFDFGPITIDASAKAALGSVHQIVEIHGSSSIVPGEALAATIPGGLLALDTNIGRTTQDRFAVLPEVDLKIGYKINEFLTAFVGYNFMYLSSVVRPGDQIDRTINVANVPTSLAYGLTGGPTSPAPQFNRTDFWAQGVTFGLLFKF